MLWPILGTLFALSIFLLAALVLFLILKPVFFQKNKQRFILFYAVWFLSYFVFIVFFTGPSSLNIYPPREGSPYRLPWKAGVKRWVGQGNRSFTSHRGLHEFAWDFVMANGTPILAARAGKVVEIEDGFDGIGLNSNFIILAHENGQSSGYFHIQNKSALVHVGDEVMQGQLIALSGMVGQTIYPHLHFVVFNKQKTESVPVSFSDVPQGVPFAGHFYISGNTASGVNNNECWSDSSKPCSLTGSLELHTFPGRPGYQDIKKGDEAETGLYLKLDQPVTVHFKDWIDEKEVFATEQIMLMHIAGDFDDKFFKIAKKKNHVSVNTPVFESQNGHHHTHFLVDAKNNIVMDKK